MALDSSKSKRRSKPSTRRERPRDKLKKMLNSKRRSEKLKILKCSNHNFKRRTPSSRS